MNLDHCYQGDCRAVMRDLIAAGVRVQCIVTSPPYWGLRDYGHPGQLGQEHSLRDFLVNMVEVFELCRQLLTDDGTLWLNMGDSYAGSRAAAGDSSSSNKGNTASKGIPAGMVASRRRDDAPIPRSDVRVEGLKPKDLVGQPWRLAFALQDAGWWLRQDIIWHKPNPMPESVRDRCTKAHEYLFLMTKSERYFYDIEAVSEAVSDTSLARWSQPGIDEQEGSDRVPGKTNGPMKAVGGPRRPQAQRAVELAEAAGLTADHIAAIRAVGITDAGKAQTTQDGFGKNDPRVQALADEAKAALGGYYREFLIAERRNRRSVWTVPTMPYKGAHFATFPEALVEPCILAGSRPGDIVFDPFMGSGTVAAVAQRLGRSWLGAELNPDYIALQDERTRQLGMVLEVAA